MSSNSQRRYELRLNGMKAVRTLKGLIGTEQTQRQSRYRGRDVWCSSYSRFWVGVMIEQRC